MMTIFVGFYFFMIQIITSKIPNLTSGPHLPNIRKLLLPVQTTGCRSHLELTKYILSEFRDEMGLKSLFRTTNEMFYERCGVGTVDISFPSNHLMFSKTIKNMNYFGSKNQFPFIIFKDSSNKNIHK